MIPRLECLEDRTPPTVVTLHGGPVLPAAQVVDINAASVNDATVRAAPGVYNAALAQYGAGIAGLASSYQVAPIPGAAVTDAQVYAALASFIAAHPPVTGQEVYIWFLSPGQGLSSALVGGWHSTVMYNGNPVVVAAVLPGNSFSLTHEIVEAVTDPVPGTGWFAEDSFHEVADLAGGFLTAQGMYFAQMVNADGGLAPLHLPGAAQPITPLVNPLVVWLESWIAVIDALWTEWVTLEQVILLQYEQLLRLL